MGPRLVFECRTSDFQEMNTDITQEMTVYFQLALASCCRCCSVLCAMYVANFEVFYVNELTDFGVLVLSKWWKVHSIGRDPSSIYQ